MSAAALRLASAGTGLRGFLAWWGAGLAAWLPASWRRLLAPRRERLLLQLEGDGLRLRREDAQGILDLATLPLPLPAPAGAGDPLAGLLSEPVAELPRWLLLPAAQGLRRSLPLPAAARERLREVLGFEVERQTPFAAADVLHDGRLLQLRGDGQLQVELVVVPRSRYEAQAARLGALAQRLAGVDLADAEGRTLGVNLLPPARRHARRDPWRWWNLALAALALLLLVLGLARLLDNRRAAADALQADVARRGEQAREVGAQRQRLLDAVEGGAYLQRQRNGRPSAVEVMDELARRLPDGTYLEKLTIEGGQLTIIGLSSEPAALVGKLEGASQWQAPALSGAMQPDPRTRLDRFTLVAQLPVPAPATEAAHAAR